MERFRKRECQKKEENSTAALYEERRRYCVIMVSPLVAGLHIETEKQQPVAYCGSRSYELGHTQTVHKSMVLSSLFVYIFFNMFSCCDPYTGCCVSFKVLTPIICGSVVARYNCCTICQ